MTSLDFPPSSISSACRTPKSFLLATAISCLVIGSAWMGCAKVQTTDGSGGNSGTGGSKVNQPTIPGLKSITISPATQEITLTQAAGSPNPNPGMASFTAMGTKDDGSTLDVTTMVNWQLMPSNGTVGSGSVTVNGAGVFTVTAYSGDIRATATLTATFKGSFFGTGFNTANQGKLDGSPSGSQITLAYPLDHAIFPYNFGAVTIQVPKPGNQDIARLSWVGDGLDFTYYGTCEAGQPGSGCYVTLPGAFAQSYFVGASSQHDIKLTVRLASTAGGSVVESNTIQVAWANVPLSGGLYYWTTIAPGAVAGYVAPDATDPRGTAVMRYNFDGGDMTPTPKLVWTDTGSPYTTPAFQGSPPAQEGTDPESARTWGNGRCIGCHAISFDGKLMAFSIGGSDASSFGLLDIAAKTLFQVEPTPPNTTPTGIELLKLQRKGKFATFTTFGPKGDLMVNMFRGRFIMRSIPDLLTQKDDLFGTATSERKTDPFWSPDGKFFTFASYDLSQGADAAKYNGDNKIGAQIWLASADATGPMNDAKIIVPRAQGVTSYYPTISHDGQMLAFNKSSCSGPVNPGGYGTGPCDGYDDITATLWLTNTSGKVPVNLQRANAGDSNSNSWPRWSPDSGIFRNQRLYWLAFSSRRPYGLQVNSGGGTGAKPQLWFAAVSVGEEFTTDPSAAGVWLPGQNISQAIPTGNHVPQWVKFAVPIE